MVENARNLCLVNSFDNTLSVLCALTRVVIGFLLRILLIFLLTENP